MRKEFLRIVLALLMMSLCNLLSAQIEVDFTYGHLNYHIQDDGEHVILLGHEDGVNATGYLYLDSSVSDGNGNWYYVNEIWPYAFAYCSNLTGDIDIPDGIVTIGSSAFLSCTGFGGHLLIRSDVTTIGSMAFAMCSGISYVECYAATPPTLGDNVFTGMTASNLMVLNGNYDAYHSSDWASYFASIHEDEFIYDGFWYYINHDFTTAGINRYAGESCPDDFEIPATATNHGIQYNVTEIGDAFSYYQGHGTLTIPATITQVWNSALEGCGFTRIISMSTVPPAVGYDWDHYLGYGSCDVLEVPAESVAAYNNSFWVIGGCGFDMAVAIGSAPTFVVDDIVYRILDEDKVKVRGFAKGVSSVVDGLTLSETVTSGGQTYQVTRIGSYAFYNYDNLRGQLTIPATVNTLGDGSFGDCDGITKIVMLPQMPPAHCPFYKTHCEVLEVPITSLMVYQMNSDWIYRFPTIVPVDGSVVFASEDVNYCVVEGENTASVLGHVDCTSATGTLTLPATVSYDGNTYNVTKINDWAFSDSPGLTGSLRIPDYVTKIGDEAFSGDSGFDGTLTLGRAIEEIGSWAFRECYGFTDVVSKDEAPDYIFDGQFSDLTCTHLTVPCGCISIYLEKQWDLFFPDIDEDCSAVESVAENMAKIYPNPSHGIVKIEVEDLRNVKIFNALGQSIYESEVSGDAFEYNFGDAPGMYLIRVKTAKGTETSRIVVM